MSFIVSFTDDVGTLHPSSFWTIRAISINMPGKTGLLIYQGWHDADAYVAQDAIVGERTYNINEPTAFDVVFGGGGYNIGSPFYIQMDGYIGSIDDLFAGIDPLSYFPLDSILADGPVSIGTQGAARVIVSWRGLIATLGSLTDGVTIKVNGVAATISSASISVGGQQIYFDLAADAGPSDIVTFEYDGSGDLLGDDSNLLAPIPTMTATNLIGSNLIFSDKYNSGHAFLPFGV